MATCGYLCPSCEGRSFLEDGSECLWCKPVTEKSKSVCISDEEWFNAVHFGDCCSDRIDPVQDEKQKQGKTGN